MTWGVVLFVIGVAFLMKNLGLVSGSVWGVLWPLVLISLGLWMISGKKSWCYHCGEWKNKNHDHGKKVEG